jgi:predicted O-linked N-acetylglucosamine transferase (SPINDLY family)
MGASYYDYLIADKVLVPVKSRPYYSEKIIYLPSYQVNDCNQEISVSHPEVISLSLPSGAFVYCCFNANYKITPRVFDVWMRILISVPNSVLLIYSESERTSETLRAEAEARGVKPNRLIFDGRLTRSEYLDRCKVADLFLDTWPYNAGATASDALWVGLPILTCMGDTFSSRVAGSILHALDMGELVTETPEEYENLAIELANNRKKIELIKEKIRIKRRSSLLFDTLGATKNIESAYKNILGRYYLNLPPDHIFIT